ncbi:HNH endonuclease [Myceligenerans xiligouense]|uniref:HNH endonuclease n=1 Tax=Myceligenerans xiligouense TaxID=253184 RepID=UPI000F4D60B9|nr:HNH endonuclease [Myceligenerans xiligouense]
MTTDAEYPPDAYTPGGVLWWELTVSPAAEKQPFGQTSRLAAWLWFNKEVGSQFTMNELRGALGKDIDGRSEHLNRRLRELRENGWVIRSQRDGGRKLRHDEYCIDKFGARYWLKEERRQHRKAAPSARVRRLVFERDGHRCVLCGVGARESYPGESDTNARLTIGHRIPQERLRSRAAADDLDNWHTECARCNELARDQMPDPHRYDEVLGSVLRIGRSQGR